MRVHVSRIRVIQTFTIGGPRYEIGWGYLSGIKTSQFGNTTTAGYALTHSPQLIKTDMKQVKVNYQIDYSH
jgi:hypothetical protein